MELETLYFSSFHNCRSMVLSAMLLRFGVPIDYVWNQAGLIYQENAAGALKFIDPFYRNIVEDDHGVRWTIETFSNSTLFLQRVREVLKAGHTAAVNVDSYELPHSIFYETQHDSHAIEVVGFADDQFMILDHPYHYAGPVSIEALKKAMEAYYHIFEGDAYGLLYVEEVQLPHQYTKDDLYRVIADNCAAMEGQIIYDYCKFPADTPRGLAAIAAIINRVGLMQEGAYPDVDADVDFLYLSLREIGNSRQLFHRYLKQFQAEQLASAVQESSQHWFAAGHLLLRAKATHDLPGVLPRAMRRLLLVQEKEQQNLELMRAFLPG